MYTTLRFYAHHLVKTPTSGGTYTSCVLCIQEYSVAIHCVIYIQLQIEDGPRLTHVLLLVKLGVHKDSTTIGIQAG